MIIGRATILHKLLLSLLLIPTLTAVFMAAYLIVFALPNDLIASHLAEAPEVLLSRRASNGRVIDADTECIGLSIGLLGPKSEGLVGAVRAESLYGCDDLMRFLKDGAADNIRPYFRYWHGYLVIARPLLTVLTYNDVRGLAFSVSLLLLGWLLWRIGEDFGAKTALAIALPFLVLNALGFWVVITKAVTWALAVGGAIVMSRRTDPTPPLLSFFMIGALTAYFDFLTAPMFIAALAAFTWILYENRAGRTLGRWMALGALGAFWFLGYAGLWVAKLGVAAAVLDAGVWADACAAIVDRLRGESVYLDGLWPGAAILANLKALKSIWGAVAIGLFVLAPVVSPKARRAAAALNRSALPILAVAFAPVLWLEILTNHSQIHAAFTHINFAMVFMVSGMLLFGRAQLLAPALLNGGNAPTTSTQ